jgi:hypothetical protein
VTYRVVVTATANAIAAFRWKAEPSAQAEFRWLAGLEKAIGSHLGLRRIEKTIRVAPSSTS